MSNVVSLQQSKQRELSTDINVITAEINSYKQIAGQAIFEIGRRLKHVKENDLAHGEWAKWCENEIGMSRQHAHRFIKVYEELGTLNVTSGLQLGVKALYEIATMPEPERTKPHTVPSTGEVKTVDEMTVRELREVKRALKEKEQALLTEKQDKEQVRKELQAKDSEVKRLQIELRKEREKEPETIEVEKTPLNVEQRLAELEERVMEGMAYKEELDKYKAQFGQLNDYTDAVNRIPNSADVTGRLIDFSVDAREFIQKYAYLENYTREISGINSRVKKECEEALLVLTAFSQKLNDNLNGYGDIIDIN